jgi:hypothetical protein
LRTRTAARAGSGAGPQPLQQKLQQHIDLEDRRIKELTEGVTRTITLAALSAPCFAGWPPSLHPPVLIKRCASQPVNTTPCGSHRPTFLRAGVLYVFFPAALRAVLPPGTDPASGLTPEAARAVAAAALAVATLMNAPPGFLDFLLSVPWAELGPLYLERDAGAAGSELVIPQLMVSPEQRAALVNQRLEAALLECVLDFLYRQASCCCGGKAACSTHTAIAVLLTLLSHTQRCGHMVCSADAAAVVSCLMHFRLLACRDQQLDSLPPMIRLSGPASPHEQQQQQQQQQQHSVGSHVGGVTRETVAAVLHGATPLHCAAIRGNPALVDHLLLCGADPLLTSAAGEQQRQHCTGAAP